MSKPPCPFANRDAARAWVEHRLDAVPAGSRELRPGKGGNGACFKRSAIRCG